MLAGGLRGQEEAKHVDVELSVERLLSNGLDRGEFIHAGVVHQDVEAAVGFHRGIDEVLRLGSLRHVALDRDRLAALTGDVGYYLVCPRLTGGVIDNNGRTFRGEL